jgi:hypothetical protein
LINLNKKYKKLKFLNKFNTLILQKIKYSLPMVVLLVLGIFAYWYKTSQVTMEVSCHLDGASCTILGRDAEFKFSVAPFPIKTEERLIFTLHLEPGLGFDSAWIQGINMYMGRIPVLPIDSIEASQEGAVELESYLGSCSEPNMRWQMIINLSDTNGVIVTRYINFNSIVN